MRRDVYNQFDWFLFTRNPGGENFRAEKSVINFLGSFVPGERGRLWGALLLKYWGNSAFKNYAKWKFHSAKTILMFSTFCATKLAFFFCLLLMFFCAVLFLVHVAALLLKYWGNPTLKNYAKWGAIASLLEKFECKSFHARFYLSSWFVLLLSLVFCGFYFVPHFVF